MRWKNITATFALCLLPASSAFAQDLAALLSDAAIASARHAGSRTIVIPPGTYRIEARGDGPHLAFSELNDFAIEANGVTVVLATPDRPGVVFDRCSNVSWRGGTFRHAALPYSQGRIDTISPDRTTLLVRVAEGYPTRFTRQSTDAPPPFYAFDPVTRGWKTGAMDLYPKRLEALDERTFRLQLAHPIPPAVRIAAGDLIAWRGRLAGDFRLNDCDGMRLEDITVKGGSGFCFHEVGGEGGNAYRINVTYPAAPAGSGETPLLSANADAFHSSGVRKGPMLERCRFEGMGDDGIAIHGVYARVAAPARETTLLLDVRLGFPVAVGDPLQITDRSGRLVARAAVAALGSITSGPESDSRWRRFGDRVGGKYRSVTLDRPVECSADDLVANEAATGSGFSIRRCVIQRHRARGMLIKASHGIIEDCLVDGSTMGGMVVSPEMGHWSESGYSTDLILQNNTIRNVGIWSQNANPIAGAMTVAAFEAGSYVPHPGGHEDIRIAGNTFEENDGLNLLITSANRVSVTNNDFVRPMRLPQSRGVAHGLPCDALVAILSSTEVDLRSNRVIEPGKEMLKRVYAPEVGLTADAFSTDE